MADNIKSELTLLPEELVDEILVRLPAKSIVRFESVCKRWKSKFHSISFITHYRKQSNKPETTKKTAFVHTIKFKQLFEMSPQLWNWQIPSPPEANTPTQETSVIGPINNGIYCIASVRNHDLLLAKIALCNPSIRQFKFLPPFPRQFRQLLSDISFDQYLLVAGFGTVPSSPSSARSDYRVVVIINYTDKLNIGGQVWFLVFLYSSLTGEWERIELDLDISYPIGRREMMRRPLEVCSQRFFNGCWFWMIDCSKVLSFNFANKSFSLIAGPPSQVIAGDDVRLSAADVFVLNGHLAAIYSHSLSLENILCSEFDVWMMMEYGVEESWTRIYSIRPNFVGRLDSLYGIDYTVGEDGIRIKGILFTGPCMENVSYFDGGGGGYMSSLRLCSDDVGFSTGGISMYRETIERL